MFYCARPSIVLVFSPYLVLVFSPSIVLVFSPYLVNVFSPSIVLVFSPDLVLVFSPSIVLVFSPYLVLVFSPSIVLLFSPYLVLVFSPSIVLVFRQHETSILMCAEVTNKIIRTDTVYEQMGIIYNRRPPNYRQAVERALLGSVVMTRLGS